jgi:hypothetical protein
MGKRKLNKKSPSAKSATSNSTKDKGTKKYYGFRVEVRRLVKKYYGTEVSEYEIKNYESKYVEYAVHGDFYIYAFVESGLAKNYFKLSNKDLCRFIVRPRAIINLGALSLYTDVSEKHSYILEEFEYRYGSISDVPEVSKECEISTRLFNLTKKGLIHLEEAIENDYRLSLDVKQDDKKVEKKVKKSRHRISDIKFKQLCKDLEIEGCARGSLDQIPFFRELSKKSKLPKYDKTERGYTTWESAKKRYYKVFPSKKNN